MALDPTIPLQVKGPQFDNPFDSYVKAAQIAQAQMQMQTAQQDMADQQNFRNALQNFNPASGDYTSLVRAAPKLGMQYQKSALEAKKMGVDMEKDRVATQKNQYEMAKGKADFVVSTLSGVTGPQDWPLARQQLERVLSPDELARVPAEYDPAIVEQGKNLFLDLQKKLDLKMKNANNLMQVGPDGEVTPNRDLIRAKSEVAMAGADKFVYDADRGLVINSRTGEAVPVAAGGVPVGAKPQKATDGERSAAGFLSRMIAAEKLMQGGGDDEKPSIGESLAGVLPGVGEAAANSVRSEKRQQVYQAQMDWVRAKLRKESGAVIGEKEMGDEFRTYFPQIGDAPAVIEQKRKARLEAQRQMEIGAGSAAGLAQPVPPMTQPQGTPTESGWKVPPATQGQREEDRAALIADEMERARKAGDAQKVSALQRELNSLDSQMGWAKNSKKPAPQPKPQQPTETQFASLPDPATLVGKTIRDTASGALMRSNGKKWVFVK